MMPTLSLEPAGRSCWDEPLGISVRGLAPGQPVTLRAALRDEKGALFRAHARYRADAHGQLDLARAPALGGSFAGLEPMGLLWAMQPDRPFWRLIKRDVQTPFVLELDVLDGHEPDGGRLLAKAEHERHFLAPGVRRVPVREGRVRATLFLPPGEGPFPGIVDVYGVGGGLPEYRASLVAGHGFATLALAFYGFEDLPKELNVIELDYFEEAVCCMLRHPQVLLLLIAASGTIYRDGRLLCSLFVEGFSQEDFLGFGHLTFPLSLSHSSMMVWKSSSKSWEISSLKSKIPLAVILVILACWLYNL